MESQSHVKSHSKSISDFADSLSAFLDRIFVEDDSVLAPTSGLDLEADVKELELKTLAQVFERTSKPFDQLNLQPYFVCASVFVDNNCCKFINNEDDALDTKPVEYRREKLMQTIEHPLSPVLLSGFVVSSEKLEVLQKICEAELRILTAPNDVSWAVVCKQRATSFAWGMLFTLKESAMKYILRNHKFHDFLIIGSVASMIIDDSIDMEEDKRASSKTLFTVVSLERARQLATKILRKCCEQQPREMLGYAPFVALNELVKLSLQQPSTCSHKNYILDSILAVAYNEALGTEKHVFDISKFFRSFSVDKSFCAIV
jgi:hypothetical protein